MLVPAMSLTEVRKEIAKDFPIIYRKAVFVLTKMEKRYRPLKGKLVEQLFDYRSKNNNRWFYKISLIKDDPIVQFMVYYESKRGLCAVVPMNESETLVYLTAHFFNRYNERLHLNLVRPYDILVSYMMDNLAYHRRRIETVSPGVHKIFCVSERGICLGTELREVDFVRLNTFVTKDMLMGDQIENHETMSKVLDKYSVHYFETDE